MPLPPAQARIVEQAVECREPVHVVGAAETDTLDTRTLSESGGVQVNGRSTSMIDRREDSACSIANGPPTPSKRQYESESHPTLSSTAMKRRMRISIGNNSNIALSPAPAPQINTPERLAHISKLPSLELRRPNKAQMQPVQQIKNFFSSPCPIIFCGPEDLGDRFSGFLLEYNLRLLVGADVGDGSLEDIVSWNDDFNVYVENARCSSDTDAFDKLLPWGQIAIQMSRKWDGPLTELYAVK